MKNYSVLEAILKFKRAILELDSSIECRIYENDLIFIIAINDNKYERFKKDLNGISFKIHSQFTLDKEIVCMPQKFISKWDIPIVEFALDIVEFTLDKEIVCMPQKFISKWDIPIVEFALDKENFTLKDLQFTYNDMIQQSFIKNPFNRIDYNYFNPNQNKERVNECKAA